jgi:cholest-4-en-3-one 26-monooxygenase
MSDTLDAPAIDLTANDVFNGSHPWDQYAWLRAHDPVHWHPEADGPGFWAITKYADIRAISRQPRLFSSAERGVMLAEPDEAGLEASRQMMLVMDPPQHDRFKLLVSRGFTPKAALTLRGGSKSSPPRSWTPCTSEASATSCPTSRGGCRRASSPS